MARENLLDQFAHVAAAVAVRERHVRVVDHGALISRSPVTLGRHGGLRSIGRTRVRRHWPERLPAGSRECRARPEDASTRSASKRFWNTPPVSPTASNASSSRAPPPDRPARAPGFRERCRRAAAAARSRSASTGNSGAQSVRQMPRLVDVRCGSGTASAPGAATLSSIIGPWPSKLAASTPRTSDAAASNRRPTEDVRRGADALLPGLRRERRAFDRRQPVMARFPHQRRRRPPRLAPARSLPVRWNGRMLATRRQAPGAPMNASPPHRSPSPPNPTPSHANTSQRPTSGCSPANAEACAA